MGVKIGGNSSSDAKTYLSPTLSYPPPPSNAVHTVGRRYPFLMAGKMDPVVQRGEYLCLSQGHFGWYFLLSLRNAASRVA